VYARELIGELEKLVNLQVFEKVRQRVNWKAFDAVIYQIANNPHHAAFYEQALDHPGIAVLHEINLHDLIKGRTLNRGGERAYLSEVMYEVFGQDFDDPGRRGLFDVPQPRTFTMLRRLLDRSERCIVHGDYAERGLRAKGFRKPVAVIPHGSSVRSLDARPYRKAFGGGVECSPDRRLRIPAAGQAGAAMLSRVREASGLASQGASDDHRRLDLGRRRSESPRHRRRAHAGRAAGLPRSSWRAAGPATSRA
jgi:hypothetical protein